MKNQLQNNFIDRDSLKNPSERDSIGNINAKKGLPRNKSQENNDASTDNPEQHPTGGGISGSDNANDNTDAEEITLDTASLQGLVDAGVNKRTQKINQELDSTKQQLQKQQEEAEEARKKLQEEADNLRKQLESERKQKATLAKVFTEHGYSQPEGDATSSVYITPMRGGMSGKDAVREYERLCDSAPTKTVLIPSTGEMQTQIDDRRLIQFIRDNRKSLRDGWESVLQKQGFLKGQSGYTSKDAATTAADIPPAFWTYLSVTTRLEHSSQFVLWQFSNREIAVGVPPGQTTAVARVRHIKAGSSSSDWRLTVGADIVNSYQPMTANSISVQIYLNGMGKNDTVQPVSIPSFIMSYSMLDLETLVSQRIGYNYNLFEDIAHKEIVFSTTKVLYNHNDDVVELPSLVTRGGQVTVNFLGSLRAKMSSDKVPTLDDGCYIFVATPYHIAQLNKDMQKNRQFFSEANVEELTNMLFKATGNNDLGKISGYKGTISGFHIFETNSFGDGVPGTTGVQTEVIAGGNKVTRTAIAMGVGAIGWATAQPMQINEDPNTNYGLNRKFIWTSHEGWGALDVDPNINPPLTNDQQLRVYEVRTTDIEIFNANT